MCKFFFYFNGKKYTCKDCLNRPNIFLLIQLDLLSVCVCADGKDCKGALVQKDKRGRNLQGILYFIRSEPMELL